MSKIIIDNNSALSMPGALELISKVIKGGRISNDKKQYCYFTAFTLYGGAKVGVTTDLNKRSDKFTLHDIYD